MVRRSLQQIMKRRFALAVGILIVVLSLWFIHSRIEGHRVQVQREAAYQNQLEHFQHDLRLGMPRSEVADYLHAHRIAYSQINQNFGVKISEEPSDSIFCEKWDVFIEMGFSHLNGQNDSSPFDNLNSISVLKIGTCL
jgi:hypothetical protein